jgi:FkbM family methyltransferase
VDFRRFVANISTAWSKGASLADFARLMVWTYSVVLRATSPPREWTIRFRYPAPIGRLRLRLRSNAGSDAFTHSEIFEHQYYRLPLPAPPATILDLGANIGLTTIFLGRTFPAARMACIEPVPENMRLLKENLSLNGIDAEVFSAAIDIEDGTTAMQRDAFDHKHRIALATDLPSDSRFDVSAISMSTVLRRLGWGRIGLLKIDIEGHEEVLLSERCEWLNLVDAICLEFHHEDGKTKLTRLAESFSFSPPQQLPGGIWFLSRSAKLELAACPAPGALDLI